MKTRLALALVLLALVPAMVSATETPKYSAATISTSNSTVDLIPSTSGSGDLWGLKCIFPSTSTGQSVKILYTIDGGAATSYIIDPTSIERESDGAGQFTTGWIPLHVHFASSVRVQLNNTSLGTIAINCWASWGLN